LDWPPNAMSAGGVAPATAAAPANASAILVTTVASESAFSTSGRVLSEHRSWLTPEILEALMCSQDWLRNKYKRFISCSSYKSSSLYLSIIIIANSCLAIVCL
jgi:hypothetical protein